MALWPLAHNHELVDGVLVDVSGNTAEHNSLRDELLVSLRPYARERNLISTATCMVRT